MSGQARGLPGVPKPQSPQPADAGSWETYNDLHTAGPLAGPLYGYIPITVKNFDLSTLIFDGVNHWAAIIYKGIPIPGSPGGDEIFNIQVPLSQIGIYVDTGSSPVTICAITLLRDETRLPNPTLEQFAQAGGFTASSCVGTNVPGSNGFLLSGIAQVDFGSPPIPGDNYGSTYVAGDTLVFDFGITINAGVGAGPWTGRLNATHLIIGGCN